VKCAAKNLARARTSSRIPECAQASSHFASAAAAPRRRRAAAIEVRHGEQRKARDRPRPGMTFAIAVGGIEARGTAADAMSAAKD
jgi:hypothetical protein